MFQPTAGIGSAFGFPLKTVWRPAGSRQGVQSVQPYSAHKNWFWRVEDFLWDAFDIDEHWLATYDASAAGAPTLDLVADGTGGQFQIKLASTSEAETAGLTMADNLYFDGAKPFYFETRMQVVHTMAANEVLVWGMASDVNTATLDNIVRNAWFRQDADTDLLIETDDATTDTDDKDTGFNVTAATWYIFSIERDRNGTIYFTKADGDGQNPKTWSMKKNFSVAEPTFSGNLQPVILCQKSSGTTTPEILVDYLVCAGAR